MTKQRKYQIKMKKLGNCIKCGAKATTSYYCKVHTEYQNTLVRNRYRTKHGIPLEVALNSVYRGRPTRNHLPSLGAKE